jgi:hypothetical protein
MRSATEKRQGHEIAVGDAAAMPRALWGFGGGGWLDEFGLKGFGRSFCRANTATDGLRDLGKRHLRFEGGQNWRLAASAGVAG